jgi:hypothetical protein
LQCVFEKRRYDPNSRTYVVVDHLNVNLQQGNLTHGVNLHLTHGVNLHLTLTQMATSEKPYRLDVRIVNNQGNEY